MLKIQFLSRPNASPHPSHGRLNTRKHEFPEHRMFGMRGRFTNVKRQCISENVCVCIDIFFLWRFG